jgi:hypothetical protein
MKLQHYLISFPIPGGYMHGYIMATSMDVAHRAAEHMMDEAEKLGLHSHLPVILETRLTSGWKMVRSIIAKHGGEPAKLWETAKDFHLTAWIMPETDPDTKRLMKLH